MSVRTIRSFSNPILTPSDVTASLPNVLKVVGTFNAGAVALSLPAASPAAVAETAKGCSAVAGSTSTSCDSTAAVGGGVLLLVRVSEAVRSEPHSHSDDQVRVPVAKPSDALDGQQSAVEIVTLSRGDPQFSFEDPRVVLRRSNSSVAFLTSLSHIRPVWVQFSAPSSSSSTPQQQLETVGIHTQCSDVPFLFPGLATHPDDWASGMLEMESWGIEDPRITDLRSLPTDFPLRRVFLDEKEQEDSKADHHHDSWEFVITYTAVSPKGAATALAVARVATPLAPSPGNGGSSTFPFRFVVRRVEILLPPENKDVCLFPTRSASSSSHSQQQVLACYHRPVPKSFGSPDMWYAESLDGLHWGHHRHILGSGGGKKLCWDGGRVGGGAPSVCVPGHGWLHLYHAADIDHRYCLGAFLAEESAPHRILGKTSEPFLVPSEPYEQVGFFPNVVFTCGVVVWDAVSFLGGRRAAGEALVAARRDEEKDGDSSVTTPMWLLVFYGAADDKVAVCWVSVSDLLSSMVKQ